MFKFYLKATYCITKNTRLFPSTCNLVSLFQNDFDLHEYICVGGSHFHIHLIEWFHIKVVLSHRRKAMRRWPIAKLIVASNYTIH